MKERILKIKNKIIEGEFQYDSQRTFHITEINSILGLYEQLEILTLAAEKLFCSEIEEDCPAPDDSTTMG
jgi:hypothetical protein